MSTVNSDITILLVDDDEVDVMGVERAFRQARLHNRIVVAANGEEALDKLRDGSSVPKPYLILLDLNMPRMSGIEFLEQTRRDPRLHPSVIFVLTTSNAEEDRKKAYQHNIAGYIVKDADSDTFLNTAALLEHYAKTVELPRW